MENEKNVMQETTETTDTTETNDTVDISEVSTVDNSVNPPLNCDLLCGISVSFDVDAVNWEDLYEHLSEMENNILTLKSMILDLSKMPNPENPQTDEEIVQKNNRELVSDDAFATTMEFMNSIGVTDLSYEMRNAISSYEKAILICNDAIIIQEQIIEYARCWVRDKEIAKLMDQLNAYAALFNPSEAETDDDEMPLYQETYEGMSVKDLVDIMTFPENHDGEVELPDENKEVL